MTPREMHALSMLIEQTKLELLDSPLIEDVLAHAGHADGCKNPCSCGYARVRIRFIEYRASLREARRAKRFSAKAE